MRTADADSLTLGPGLEVRKPGGRPSRAGCIPVTSVSTGPLANDSSVVTGTPAGIWLKTHSWTSVMRCNFQHPPEAEARFFIASDGSRWHLHIRRDLGYSWELTPTRSRLSHVCPTPGDPHPAPRIPAVTPVLGGSQFAHGAGQPPALQRCG